MRRVSYLLLGFFFAAALFTPIFFLIKQAFFAQGVFSFDNFEILFVDTLLVQSLLNSIAVAVWVCILSIAIALLLSNGAVRRKTFGRGVLDVCVLAPLFLPPIVGVLGLKALVSRSGTINILLIKSGFVSSPIDFLSPASPYGVIVVQVVHFYPLVYLQLLAAFSRYNSELEEAAISVGATTWQWLTQVSIPLLSPALISSALLVFVGSFTDIGTPLLFEYRDTVAVRVFNMLTDTANSGAGYALVFIVGCISLILFSIARWFERDMYVVGTGRSVVPLKQKPIRGWSEYLIWILCLAIAILSIAPHGGVLLQALAGRWFMTPMPESFTLHHFMEVFIHPIASGSLLYSIALSIASTVLVSCIGFMIAWGAVRRGSKIDRFFEYCAMMPLTIPGVVIAFGLMLGYSGTIVDNRTNPTALLILAYTIRKLPFMVRILSIGLQQMGVHLEEAALLCGARWSRVLRKITIPLLLPSFISGAMLCFIGGLLEVSDSLLLALEEKYYPVAKALFALQGRPDGPPVASALGVVVMGVVLVGFYIASRSSGRKISELLAQ